MPKSSWRWRVFAATWLSYAGFYFCRKPFSIVKGTMGEELGIDATSLATIGTAYLLAYTVGQFIAGAAGNRWGARILLLIGMAVAIGTGIGFGFSNSVATFSALMVLNGLGQATGWSNNVGNMASWFGREERGRVMGVWATCYQVGGVAANTLAAFILGAYGWRHSFFAGAAVLTVVWIFFVFNQRNQPSDVGLPELDEPGSDGATAEESGWSWLTGPVLTNMLMVGAFYFFVKFIRYAIWSWAPYFLDLNFGLEGDEAGYFSTTFDIAGIAGVLAAGWLSDKVFKSKRAIVSLLFMVGMAIACGVMYVAGQTSPVVFAALLGIVGFTLYGPDALMTGAGAMDIGSRRGATFVAGVINGMGSVGSVVQELVIGKMYDDSAGDLGPIFGLLMGASIGATVLIGVVVLRNRNQTAGV
ncbi:MAG: MFS transporter [Proteobacteria bacterium]|nr:MFS transporter [Pseudomonadota bacterium]MCP4921667.1 MFS transporter [Pseudomonadota bacterium]